MEYVSHSEKQTDQIAQNLVKILQGGEVIALSGDLGTGKTTFVKGVAKAFGIARDITSPTFAILKEYPVNFGRIKKMVHVDAYRLAGAKDAEAIGLPEFFDNQNAVTLIEWPENIETLLPQRMKILKFEYIDEKTRKITIS